MNDNNQNDTNTANSAKKNEEKTTRLDEKRLKWIMVKDSFHRNKKAVGGAQEMLECGA